MTYTLHQGDCLDVLRALPDASVDAIVTDPPYGLSFMGKRWDYDVPSTEVWAECLRVLKPGGHLLAFAGTRTQHRMAVRIEDAGFEIRDLIAWVYGSGFPKSLDVSKAIDKGHGENRERQLQFTAWMRSTGITAEQINEATSSCMASHYLTDKSQPAIATADMFDKLRPYLPEVPEYIERLVCERTGLEWTAYKQREVIGHKVGTDTSKIRIACSISSQGLEASTRREFDITAPSTPAARQWQGWGTALKPSLESVTVATKPLTADMERAIIRSNLLRLEAKLWLLLFASAAGSSSASSPSELGGALATAQWSAEDATNTRDALCDQMGTSLFELATTTSLNIVSSWRRIFDEGLGAGNTSTIETESRTTIDWRILRFSLSQITPESIVGACSQTGGFSANASLAEKHFNASLSFWQSTRALSVTALAIAREAESCRGADVAPNLDPCIMARKPLDGTVAENVLAHGTGALNVDGCRVGTESVRTMPRNDGKHGQSNALGLGWHGEVDTSERSGRWPANLIHDGSEEVVGLFPGDEDGGSAARFFYEAKAGGDDDRHAGCSGLFWQGAENVAGWSPIDRSEWERRTIENERARKAQQPPPYRISRGSIHTTVKPTDLMRYLCRLVTPPGGVVLDPFTGSGSTGRGAILEGFRFVGIEREAEYVAIARSRIEDAVGTRRAQTAQGELGL